jgi:ribonucleotide reductase beta subunit family protein with ferritin-like domain
MRTPEESNLRHWRETAYLLPVLAQSSCFWHIFPFMRREKMEGEELAINLGVLY